MLQVWGLRSKLEENRLKFDRVLDSWFWSTNDQKINKICAKICRKFVSFVVQLAQSAIQILVPGFVPISTPPNCFNWCSTDASGTLSGHFWSAPGTLLVVPEHSLGALGCPRRVPGPIPVDFRYPEDQNCFKFNQSRLKFRSKIRSRNFLSSALVLMPLRL